MSLVDLLQGEQRQTQIRLLFALGDKKNKKPAIAMMAKNAEDIVGNEK